MVTWTAWSQDKDYDCPLQTGAFRRTHVSESECILKGKGGPMGQLVYDPSGGGDAWEVSLVELHHLNSNFGDPQ